MSRFVYMMTPNMETFSRLLTFVKGIHRLEVDSSHKGSILRGFDDVHVVRLKKLLKKQWWDR